MSSEISRPLSIVLATAIVTLAGCNFSAGPAYFRIDTGGARHDDFVIEPIQEYGRIHSSDMVVMDPLIVASEKDLTLPPFATDWFFSTLLVQAFHPEYVYSWTGKADSSSDELILSPLRPRRWSDYLEEHGEVSMQVVGNHLDLLLTHYVPAFEPGEPRNKLRRYLRGLRELVGQAQWLAGDSRYWATEAAGRAALEQKLQALDELMQ